MTRYLGALTIDPTSRRGADSLAQSLREIYKDYPHFRADVFESPGGTADDPVFVVRTNLIAGVPPAKPTDVFISHKEHLRRVTRRPKVAA